MEAECAVHALNVSQMFPNPNICWVTSKTLC